MTNRALLRSKFSSLDTENDKEEEQDIRLNCSNELDWKFIDTVNKGIDENIDNSEFNVDVLCELLNMSRTSLYNKIRALTNQTPSDYVRLIRLKRAAKLLKEGEHNINEISDMTGFNDAKYFREVFKKHFNMSPSKYAKASTQKEKKIKDKEESEE